jgi:hypothetical protein
MLLADGIAVSPVAMIELSPAFDGDISEQKRFLEGAGSLLNLPFLCDLIEY